MRITRRMLGIAALAMALSGMISRAEAKGTGFTLGANIAYGGGLMFGGNLGYRGPSTSFIVDGYFSGASAGSISITGSYFRFNVNFGSDFFIGPHAGLAIVSITGIPGYSGNYMLPTFGGQVGYNFWLGETFSVSPILHLSYVIVSLAYDVGAQVNVTF